MEVPLILLKKKLIGRVGRSTTLLGCAHPEVDWLIGLFLSFWGSEGMEPKIFHLLLHGKDLSFQNGPLCPLQLQYVFFETV